jgi:hypothetical protein
MRSPGVVFWIGVIWTFFWAILASIYQADQYLRVLTFEELSDTVWTTTGPLMTFWGFAPTLGAVVAGIGVLIRAGARGPTVWKFGIGITTAVILSFVIGSFGHFPPLYGIGGTLILLLFFGTLWLWIEERKALQGQSTTPADLRLVGYVFMLIATWYTCGIASPSWYKAFANQTPMMEPISVMIFFVLGWLFLFLSHYRSRPRQTTAAP